jgi:glucosamine 6-phosphate synthetase-like amidotransferase/phosphosugar isomerase protein
MAARAFSWGSLVCGIAGYSLSVDSRVHRTLAAQALLAGIAERGADAVGYAWTDAGPEIGLHKQRSGASALLDQLSIPQGATSALLHVRDYTKGHPTIEANNHPIRHGPVVGIHNGVIANDEEIFAEGGFERAAPEMTVDSEAIFALMEASGGRAQVLEQIHGSMAAAWLDVRYPGMLFVARGVARPLWLGEGKRETFFASTRDALELLEDTVRMTLRKREFGEGSFVAVLNGRVVARERFHPDRSFVEEKPLPAVRAPHERVRSLRRLAVLASL